MFPSETNQVNPSLKEIGTILKKTFHINEAMFCIMVRCYVVLMSGQEHVHLSTVVFTLCKRHVTDRLYRLFECSYARTFVRMHSDRAHSHVHKRREMSM